MFDNQSLEVTCSHCQHRITKDISWLECNHEIVCPACSQTYVIRHRQLFKDILDSSELKNGLGAAFSDISLQKVS